MGGKLNTSLVHSVSRKQRPRKYNQGPRKYKEGPRKYKEGPRKYKQWMRKYKQGPRKYKQGPRKNKQEPRKHKERLRKYLDLTDNKSRVLYLVMFNKFFKLIVRSMEQVGETVPMGE